MKLSARSQGIASQRPLTEAQFLRTITELAHVAHWRTFHQWISLHSPSGFPDLLLAKAGEPLILAELKTTIGRLTPAQSSWLELLQQVEGLEVYVWRPRDWPAIEARLFRPGAPAPRAP